MTHFVETARHRTAWIEAGPIDGPLMIFVHGWPELGLVWRAQLAYFSQRGWRCIAPDMRGYGGSSIPESTDAYAVRELTADMVELHDALGGAPAVWVGHDWGSPVVWALAAHHPTRCRAVASLCVPYIARGFAVANLLPLVDRDLYPADTYPYAQWDYIQFYNESFERARRDFESDVSATLAMMYRRASATAVGKRALTSGVRARGGWFGSAGRAPATDFETILLPPEDFETLVATFRTNGFRGPDAWYVNDAANIAYAAEAPNDGRIALPVLFVHAAWDVVCATLRGRFADPMRADCSDLYEATIAGGHELMLERPDDVNAAIAGWIHSRSLGPNI
jgi:pimeloyl-ACP methyl ester carboxylesterase